MFTEEYLNTKAEELGREVVACLNQIRAFGKVNAEERFRYQQLFKKMDGLSHRVSRYKISVHKTPLPEDLDDWLVRELEQESQKEGE